MSQKIDTSTALNRHMQINTLSIRESFDRAPYSKSACGFESGFLPDALTAALRGLNKQKEPLDADVPGEAACFGKKRHVQQAHKN